MLISRKTWSGRFAKIYLISSRVRPICSPIFPKRHRFAAVETIITLDFQLTQVDFAGQLNFGLLFRSDRSSSGAGPILVGQSLLKKMFVFRPVAAGGLLDRAKIYYLAYRFLAGAAARA